MRPITDLESPDRESKGVALLFFNLGARGGGCLTPRPGRFNHGKETRQTLYRRLSGPHGLSERVRKILPQPGFDARRVQPVANRCVV